MTQAIDAFAADVRAALAVTGGDAAEHASVAARRLIRELAEARKAEQTAENLAGQISEQQRQAQDAGRRIATNRY